MAATRKPRRSWTPDDLRTLKRLAKSKLPVARIARELKRSVTAIYQRASKLGIAIQSQRPSR